MCTPMTSGVKKVNGLAQHRGFGFDPADAPTYDTEAVDHRRMRVCADKRIREVNVTSFPNILPRNSRFT